MVLSNKLNARARVGKRPLADALAIRFPHLTRAQRQQAEEMIIKKLAEAISKGREVWFYERLPDGSFEISALVLEELVSRVTDQIRAR